MFFSFTIYSKFCFIVYMMHWGFCIYSYFFLSNYPALWETDIPTCHTSGWISQHITKQRICLKSLRDSLYQLPFAGIFFTLLYFLFSGFSFAMKKREAPLQSIKPGFGGLVARWPQNSGRFRLRHSFQLGKGCGCTSCRLRKSSAAVKAPEVKAPEATEFLAMLAEEEQDLVTLFLWPCGCWCWCWWYCCVIYSIYSSFLAAKMES